MASLGTSIWLLLALPACGTIDGESESPSIPTGEGRLDPGTTARVTPVPEVSPEPTASPNPTPSPSPLLEAEPNGWQDAATLLEPVNGRVDVAGTCADGGDVDFFRIAVTFETIELHLEWTEGETAADIDVVLASETGPIAEDTALPPGDSPVEMAAAGDGTPLFIEVDCYNNSAPGMSYVATILLP